MRQCHICPESYEAGQYRDHKRMHAPELYGRRRNRTRDRGLIFRQSLILMAVRHGASGADIARTHGISRERIRQIWTRATGTPMPKRGSLNLIPRDRQSIQIRRFWSRVRIDESGCWLWAGSRFPTGYGHVTRRTFGDGYAHRAAYAMVNGPIPAGLTLDHLCRVPACVNPDHLEAVTQRENTLRSPIAPAAINARKTHCPKGHPYDVHDRHGRSCRACRNAGQRAYQRRKAAQDAA